MCAAAAAERARMPGVILRDGRVIPRGELRLRASRSSGPGGQHVNKTSSKVELRWHLDRSVVLTDQERVTLRRVLATRLDAAGAVVIVASDTPSQLRNRLLAERRLAELVGRALAPRTPRVRSGPPAQQRARRLDAKRRRSALKVGRQRRDLDE